jgi:hypothetical protein
MLSDRLKTRLKTDRPMVSVTVRIPVDVVEAMKAIAPQRGFTGYQGLLKSYLSDGLRRDEAQVAIASQAKLVEALKRHGVPGDVIALAEQEALTV